MIGQTIGKYRILDRVGRGGMGTVYRALDETLHREVAIKILNAELNDPEVARRFRAEAVTVARLNHPGIATIFELFQHDGQWMMVMEFVRGETLERMVERLGPLSPQRAADLAMQGLTALSHAHSLGVVHRDLKPANLMITESGTVKIMDFGIARVAGAEHLTSAGFMMGTPAYMAPEQVLGNEIDARTDLYAVGVVFYYLVSAKLPFKGDTPIAMAQSRVTSQPTPVRTMRQGLPAWIDPVIDRSLAREPPDRFQTADQFREALRRGLAGLPMEVLTTGSVPPELVATTPPRALPMGTPMRTPTGATGPGVPAITPQPQPIGQTNPGQPSPNNRALFGILALIFILIALFGALWFRSFFPARTDTTGGNQPPAGQTAGTPATAEPTPPPPPPAGTPATNTTTGAPGTGGAATNPNAPVTAPGTSQPGGVTTAAPPAPAAGVPVPPGARDTAPPTGAAPARGVLDPNATVLFSNVKLMVSKGRQVDAQDVSVNFLAAMVSVTPKQGGAAISSIQYRGIVKATYVRAKDPKWDPALTSPPDGFEVPGILRGVRHWLVLQGRASGELVILRLEDENYKQVIGAVEARTGLRVDRPATSGG
jgi:serine/threonine protein kinase